MVSTRKLGQVILTTLINRPIQVLRAFRPAFSKFRCSWRTAFLRRPPWHIASSTARRATPVAISSISRSSIQPVHLSNRAEPSPKIQARTSRQTREPGVRPAQGMNGAQSSASWIVCFWEKTYHPWRYRPAPARKSGKNIQSMALSSGPGQSKKIQHMGLSSGGSGPKIWKLR